MSPDDIERLSLLAHRAGIAELELAEGDTVLRLRIATSTVSGSTTAARIEDGTSAPKLVRAPGVGLFRHRHPVTGRPAVEAGQPVKAGQTVGYLEAGPCLRGVVASDDGTIGAAVIDDGTLVGFGTVLYRLA